MLEIPERWLGGCEKHKLNGTTKLLKDKPIDAHTINATGFFPNDNKDVRKLRTL